MEMSFHWIPARDPGVSAAELNRVMSSRRVVGIDRQFCVSHTDPGWAICLTLAPGDGDRGGGAPGRRDGVDYRQVLDPPTFAIFAALRAWRKGVAEKESIPPYAVLTNEQLAEVARRDCRAIAAIEDINGIGPARIRKYGADILAVLERLRHESGSTEAGP